MSLIIIISVIIGVIGTGLAGYHRVTMFRKIGGETQLLHRCWLIVFSVFVSAVETIGISVIMPFIDIVKNFKTIRTNQHYKRVFDFFSFEKKLIFLLPMDCFNSFLGAG